MSEQRESFANWAGNQRSRPLRVHRPRGDHAIADLIGRARQRGETIKAVGAGHSWTDAACTDGHLVRLDDDPQVLHVDREQCTVTVRAGIRLKDLSQALRTRGLALSNLGSISEQSIAGAISTGTHGTGIGFGNLATQVIAMTLITGTGQILQLSATEHPELFSAARVGLGCLGIISQVTLQCEPAFFLHERRRPMPFAQACGQLQTLVENHQHTKLWWLPHTDTVQVFVQDRTVASRTAGAELQHRLENHPLLSGLLAGLLKLGRLRPHTIPRINRLLTPVYFRQQERVERSDRVFGTIMPPRHMEAEYAIPLARTEEALTRVRALIEGERLRVGFIQELRFVAADDILLSPAFGRDSCQFGAYTGELSQNPYYLRRFEQLMLELDGRPHWGKWFSIDHRVLRERLPGFERFAAIRARLDPDGVFVNDFTRRVFGL